MKYNTLFIKFTLNLCGLLSMFFGFSACYSLYTGNVGFMLLELPAMLICFGMVCMLTDKMENFK